VDARDERGHDGFPVSPAVFRRNAFDSNLNEILIPLLNEIPICFD